MLLAGCASPCSATCAAAACGVLAEQSASCKAALPLLSPLANAASMQARLCVLQMCQAVDGHHTVPYLALMPSLAAATCTHTHTNLCCRYVNLQQGLAEDVARWFFQQIVLALDYMHRYNTTLWRSPLMCALSGLCEGGRCCEAMTSQQYVQLPHLRGASRPPLIQLVF